MPIDTHDPIQTTTKRMTIETDYATVNTQTDTTPTNAAVGLPTEVPLGKKYIGARYVPLFADPYQWDKETTYEPLTIVYNEGNSYTSKQYVPAGIEIDNEDYWALTGNYNAQIEQYRQEVANEKADRQEADEQLQTAIDGKAPIDHADPTNKYGQGSATNFGHVKLTDELGTGNAASGVAATPDMATAVARQAVDSLKVTEQLTLTPSTSFKAHFSSPGSITVNRRLGLMMVSVYLDCTSPVKSYGAVFTIGATAEASHDVSRSILRIDADDGVAVYNGLITKNGEFQTYSPINSGEKVWINVVVDVSTWGGDYASAVGASTPETVRQSIVNKFKGWQGTLKYNRSGDRLNPDTSNETDCSGAVFAAYRDAGNYIMSGDDSSEESNGGGFIADAQPGTVLDFTNAKPGDIVGVAHTPYPYDYFHVLLYTGDSEHPLWEMNSWGEGFNKGKLGTQPCDLSTEGGDGTPGTFYKNEYRRIVRYIYDE